MTTTISRQQFMEILKSCFTGTPHTSWDTILDNVLMDFEAYGDDEISSFLADQYAEGKIDEREILSEFENFCIFAIYDITEYDVV